MTRKEEYNSVEIIRARGVISLCGNISFNEMSYSTRFDIVKMHYEDIRGVPLEKVSEQKIYRIAKSLYDKSFKIAEEFTSFEEIILENIQRLGNVNGKNEKSKLEERICMQLDGFSDDSSLVELFQKTRK